MNVICLKPTQCKFDLKFSIVVWVLAVLLMESNSRNKLLLISENSLKLLRHSPHQYTENCLGTFELTCTHSTLQHLENDSVNKRKQKPWINLRIVSLILLVGKDFISRRRQAFFIMSLLIWVGEGCNLTPCWFYFNNSEMVNAVTLAFCIIQ